MKQFIICSILGVCMVSCNNSINITQLSPTLNQLKSGNKFHIILPENHTTGYLWQLSHTYDEEKIGYLNSVWHGNEKGVHFNFIAADKGIDTLNFTLIKYRDTTEVKSFIIDIK